WTQKHLLETTMIATLGPSGWSALWKKGANWNSNGVKTALNRYKELLTYTNSDSASLTWQDASKLVADGKAAFNIMGDWADKYLKWALQQWKSDKLAGSLTHGVVASNAWNTDIDTALGLFLQSKNVGTFQSALVSAAKKRAT